MTQFEDHAAGLHDAHTIIDKMARASRERDAFVKLFDPEHGNVVCAMTQAQSLAARCAEAEAERDRWHSRAEKYLAVLKCANNNTRRSNSKRDEWRRKYEASLTVLRVLMPGRDATEEERVLHRACLVSVFAEWNLICGDLEIKP